LTTGRTFLSRELNFFKTDGVMSNQVAWPQQPHSISILNDVTIFSKHPTVQRSPRSPPARRIPSLLGKFWRQISAKARRGVRDIFAGNALRVMYVPVSWAGQGCAIIFPGKDIAPPDPSPWNMGNTADHRFFLASVFFRTKPSAD
jgi:hypothetical protein